MSGVCETGVCWVSLRMIHPFKVGFSHFAPFFQASLGPMSALPLAGLVATVKSRRIFGTKNP